MFKDVMDKESNGNISINKTAYTNDFKLKMPTMDKDIKKLGGESVGQDFIL